MLETGCERGGRIQFRADYLGGPELGERDVEEFLHEEYRPVRDRGHDEQLGTFTSEVKERLAMDQMVRVAATAVRDVMLAGAVPAIVMVVEIAMDVRPLTGIQVSEARMSMVLIRLVSRFRFVRYTLRVDEYDDQDEVDHPAH